jgi:hypothetical protein
LLAQQEQGDHAQPAEAEGDGEPLGEPVVGGVKGAARGGLAEQDPAEDEGGRHHQPDRHGPPHAAASGGLAGEASGEHEDGRGQGGEAG